MCHCNNIEIGSYKNQIMIPNWWNGKLVCIDRCLLDEILYLWRNSIITTSCCCGHNKKQPYICVKDLFHNNMKLLGYKYFINQFNVICYIPKKIK